MYNNCIYLYIRPNSQKTLSKNYCTDIGEKEDNAEN